MKKILMLFACIVLAVSATASVLFSDDFSYVNGSLTAVSGGIWANHSGTAGQVDVSGGLVNLTAAESEDVNAVISGGPYLSGTLYFSMAVNFSALPGVGGGYFAHFKDATTSGFRARLFTTTTGAAPGMFRLGVNNGSNLPVTGTLPLDLSLLTTYQVVVRYDASAPANAATIWVNPSLETDPSATATDGVTALGITSIALRQSTITAGDMGTLTVDNLRVATTFAEVVPEPSVVTFGALGGMAAFVMVRRRKM